MLRAAIALCPFRLIWPLANGVEDRRREVRKFLNNKPEPFNQTCDVTSFEISVFILNCTSDNVEWRPYVVGILFLLGQAIEY